MDVESRRDLVTRRTRIVSSETTDGVDVFILVVDLGTGFATMVADGTSAIWLDDHTLLVEA